MLHTRVAVANGSGSLKLRRTGPIAAIACAALLSLTLAGCSGYAKYAGISKASFAPTPAAAPAPKITGGSGNVDLLISRYAATYSVPESLVRRVVAKESGFNPKAKNGPYLGLMQISHATAKSMGYSGSSGGLLDAETNLKYAVKYLRGAYITAGGNSDQAVRLYQRGYYYDAKRKGLLEEAGLR